MRVLLAGILILLPLNAQGQLPSAPCDERRSTPCAEPAVPPVTDHTVVPENVVNDQALGLYENPYGPTSATNFDPFAAPLAPRPDVNDRSRLSVQRDDSGPADSVYGHFGNSLFPDSIMSRGNTAHPFAMDSSTNLYGRGGPVQGRSRY